MADTIEQDLARIIDNQIIELQRELTTIFYKAVQNAAQNAINRNLIPRHKLGISNFASNIMSKIKGEHVTLEESVFLEKQVTEMSDRILKEAINILNAPKPTAPAPTAPEETLSADDLQVLTPIFNKFKEGLLSLMLAYFNKVKRASMPTGKPLANAPTTPTPTPPAPAEPFDVNAAIEDLPEYMHEKAAETISGALLKHGPNKGRIKGDSDIIDDCIQLIIKLRLDPESNTDIRKIWPSYRGENLMKDQKEQIKKDGEELMGKRRKPMESTLDKKLATKILKDQSTDVLTEYYKNLIKYGI